MATITSLAGPSFTPALPPPVGVQSNPEHPDSLAKWSNLTIGVCAPLVTIFFGLRIYIRAYLKRTWTAEDWLIFMSWSGSVAFFAILAVTIDHHGGEHLWDISPAQAMDVSYWFNIAALEYALAICLTKLSILWLYRRVFSPRKGSPFEITVYALVASCIIFYGSTAIAKVFQCWPRSKIMDPSIPGSCIDLKAVLFADGVFNTVTDIIILLLPATAVYRLHMAKKKKFVVLAVFTFGLCVVGFYVRVKLGGTRDFAWNEPAILLWGAAELCTGLMCVCLPEFGVLCTSRHRSPKSPSKGILHEAAGRGLSNSRRHGTGNMQTFGHSRRQDSSINNAIIGRGTTGNYIELDEEHGQRTEVYATTPSSGTSHISTNAVHVKYDITVNSE